MSPTKCSECDKVLDLIPLWLDEVTVSFTCEDCRQKHRSVAPSRGRKIAPIDISDDLAEVIDPLEALVINKDDDTEISLEALQEEEALHDDLPVDEEDV